jgi:hypothetical protein
MNTFIQYLQDQQLIPSFLKNWLGGKRQRKAATGHVDYLRNDGTLWSYLRIVGNGYDWTEVDGDVKTFAVDPTGHLDYLRNNGILWSYPHIVGNGYDWTNLDQNVQSFWLTGGGYLLDALETTNGTIRQFSGY